MVIGNVNPFESDHPGSNEPAHASVAILDKTESNIVGHAIVKGDGHCRGMKNVRRSARDSF